MDEFAYINTNAEHGRPQSSQHASSHGFHGGLAAGLGRWNCRYGGHSMLHASTVHEHEGGGPGGGGDGGAGGSGGGGGRGGGGGGKGAGLSGTSQNNPAVGGLGVT